MPKGKDEPTDENAGHTTFDESMLSRRRLLQAAGAGMVGSAFLIGTGSAAESPDRLEVVAHRGSEIEYSVTCAGTIERVSTNSVVSAESDEDAITQNDDGTYTATGYTADGYGDAFELSGAVYAFEASAEDYTLYLNGSRTTREKLVQVPTSQLVIETPADGSVEYTFSATGEITKALDNGDNSAESKNDAIVQNDDGTWTATGLTGNGYGDSYNFEGSITDFSPAEGSFTLYLDGTEVTTYELTGEEPPAEREHSYSFEGTGDSWADYYLEVEDGGDMIASTLDGAIIEPDFHWVSADGTKAAGRVDPGERHAYEFDNLVLDVTIEGEADAFVDGRPSNLDYYPQPGATGDDWKSGFPWQEEETIERENSYSFEGTGDSWADYYLEVEDGGDMVASTLDGAVIEDEFHWVSEDGTKAAGRVDPGERHAYEFDNLVLDVTIEGEADAFVNGSPSNLDYYPQPGATGDDWKGGFPWQDEETTTTSSNEPIGGGAGYPNTITQSEADAVVRTRSALENALSSASAGDVVFVPGGEQISLGNRRYTIPDGVTLASNRGVNGSSGALLHTDYEPWKLLIINGSGRLTGVRLKGPHPGDDTSGNSGSSGVTTHGAGEVDNCDIWGFSYAGVRTASGDGAHIHHNVIRENNRGGYGYGVAAPSGKPLVEYNYLNFNRHSVKSAGNNQGYTARYNHFGPKSTGGVIDVHEPGGVDLEVHNNVIEPVVSTSGHRDPLQSIQIRGVPAEAYDVHDNWFFNEHPPRNSPAGWTNESIIQPTESSWQNVNWWDNYYGADANVTYSDIIPGYDGWRSP